MQDTQTAQTALYMVHNKARAARHTLTLRRNSPAYTILMRLWHCWTQPVENIISAFKLTHHENDSTPLLRARCRLGLLE
jgi:hypothetical protein